MNSRPPERSDRDPAGFLARTADSSLILRPLREVCRDSLFCRLVVRIGRSMSGRTSWLGTRVARHPATRAFPRAIGIARASVLFGGIDRWFSIVPHAWQQSLVNRWLDRTFGHLDASQRVRLIGWAVLAAALTHAVLAAPALLDNWRAMIIWALGSAIGLVFLVASGPLAAAWRSRRS